MLVVALPFIMLLVKGEGKLVVALLKAGAGHYTVAMGGRSDILDLFQSNHCIAGRRGSARDKWQRS